MLTICDAETYLQYMKDDPVRPNLFGDDTARFRDKFYVFADVDEDDKTVNAILCAVLSPFVIQTEELLRAISEDYQSMQELEASIRGILDDKNIATILTPYSLWSYRKGSGKKLINELLDFIPLNFPRVTHVITMSPPTKMAMLFHTGNGARLLSPNSETINYEYRLANVTLH